MVYWSTASPTLPHIASLTGSLTIDSFGCGSKKKACTPGDHQNRWQMDVHPPQNGIAIGSAPWPIPLESPRFADSANPGRANTETSLGGLKKNLANGYHRPNLTGYCQTSFCGLHSPKQHALTSFGETPSWVPCFWGDPVSPLASF